MNGLLNFCYYSSLPFEFPRRLTVLIGLKYLDPLPTTHCRLLYYELFLDSLALAGMVNTHKINLTLLLPIRINLSTSD